MRTSCRNNAFFLARPILFLTAIILFCAASAALAHSVSLWAYVEKGRVYVEAFFSDGAKVQDGPICVVDAKGKKLLEGKTDKEGKFDFIPPVKEEMTILLRLGGGHGAEFKLKAKDFKETNMPDKGKPSIKPDDTGSKDKSDG